MEKKELQTTYNPKEFEARIFKTWQDKKYFTPKVDNSYATTKYNW